MTLKALPHGESARIDGGQATQRRTERAGRGPKDVLNELLVNSTGEFGHGALAPVAHRRMIAGIVGGIGAGKSTVRRLFAELGAHTVDADALAHEALETPRVRAALKDWLGDRVFDQNDRVNRKVVADYVFSIPEKLRELEALVHPFVIRKLERQVEEHEALPEPRGVLILDVPLLLSSPLRSRCQDIVYVDAPEPVRLARVLSRGWDAAELKRRERLQMPPEEKRRLATVFLDNSTNLEETRRQVRDLYLRWTTKRKEA